MRLEIVSNEACAVLSFDICMCSRFEESLKNRLVMSEARNKLINRTNCGFIS